MITNLKEFDKFLAICRKHGVKSVKAAGAPEVVFDDSRPVGSVQNSDDVATPDALSPEDLLFYAVQQPPAS